MALELQATKTPITKEQAIQALWQGWLTYFGANPPKKECLWVLAAQWALETGWGKSMWDYNFGNAKSIDGDGYDYQYFACDEILTTAQAQKYLASAPPGTVAIRPYATEGLADVWFYPKHPGCRFRAFTSAAIGAADYVKMVATRFSKAWPYVDAGDPRGFVHALKMQGYFTADETQYTNGLVGCYTVASKANVDYSGLGDLSAAASAQVDQVVADSIDQSISDAVETELTSDSSNS